MQDQRPEAVAARLRLALEMFEDALSILALKLRRTQPNASEEEIQAKIEAWVSARPGAESGDFSEMAPESLP